MSGEIPIRRRTADKNAKLIGASIWAAWALATCTMTVFLWGGRPSRELSHEELVEAIRSGDNVPAAAVELRRRLVQALRVLVDRTTDEGRSGLAARIELQKIVDELSKPLPKAVEPK